MGAVSSACEGCFGAEKHNPQATQLNPKTHEDKRKYVEPTNETHDDTAESKIAPPESLKGVNSSVRKQNTGINGRQSSKKKGEDGVEDKNKKLTIKDFDLIRVKQN